MPLESSLRKHLSSSAVLLAGVALAIFGVFISALILPYAFTDDYPILFISDRLGSSRWFGDSVIDTVSASGRPLAGILDQLFFSAAGTIDNLRFVRLASVVGIVLLAFLLHWALVRSRVKPVPAALIAVLVCTLPAFEVYGSWAVLFNAPYAALLAGGASMLAVTAREGPRDLTVDRFVGATALLLAGLLIYQPAAMFFWVFFAIALVGTVPDGRRAMRLTWTHGGVAFAAFAVTYVVRKVAIHLAQNAPNARSDVFEHHPIAKLDWFVHQPLYWALNLFDLSPSHWLAAFVASVAAAGILIGLWRRGANVFLYVVIGLALVPLCLAPNLAVTGRQTTYRMLGSLSALVTLYFCLGAMSVWLVFLQPLRASGRRLAAVWAERLGLASAVAFVAMAAIVAARNVTTLIVVPQNTELRLIRNKVAALPTGASRVGYIVIGWNQGFAQRIISDEFTPSSTEPWVGQPAVILTLRDEGRLTKPPPIVDTLPFDTTAFPTKEPVVDLRDLQNLR